MKRKSGFFVLAILLLMGLFLLSSCGESAETDSLTDPVESGEETDPSERVPPTETEEEGAHTHAYLLTQTTKGTCAEYGYDRYECSCGLSYKELIPASHSYTTVTDVTGAYTKTVCTACGAYTIARNQTYLYNIDFENAKDPADAAKKQPNLEFYTIAGGGTELVKDGENTFMKIAASNYYVRDLTGVLADGRKVVFSMDLKVEKFAQAELLSIVYLDGEKWAYNRGIVRLEADGSLGFYTKGNGKYTQKVQLSEKGFVTITVAGDMTTGLFDVYVNGEMVREGIQYLTPASKKTKVYIRYFDQKKDYVAYADNLKFYAADAPEFVVSANGIVFDE